MSKYPITAQTLEILSSRICHDLIGPVSAVNNGVEFWEEMGADAGDDAIGLIGHSAAQASYKLQLFRLAYASGGAEIHVKLDDIKAAFSNFIEELRAELVWELPEAAYEGALPRGFCKVALNLMMVGVDMLPKGGNIVVRDASTGESHKIDISLEGEDLAVNIDYKDALDGKTKPENLSPKTVHPYMTMAYAEQYGLRVHIEPTDAGVCLSISKA